MSLRPANQPTNAPHTITGVELLNTALNDLRQRIDDISFRVSTLANQFGTPNIGEEGSAGGKQPETTNEHMASLDAAMKKLEQTTSRIDNQ